MWLLLLDTLTAVGIAKSLDGLGDSLLKLLLPIGLGIYVVLEWRSRRREKKEERELPGGGEEELARER